MASFLQRIAKKMSLFSSDIGIDLGTATVLVYVKGKGVVLNEPSVVAVDKVSGKILAVGEEAQSMLGRTPGNIVAVRPLRQGVISDFTVTEKMLDHFIKKAVGKKTFRKPKIAVCVPSGVTEVEKKAVEDATYQAGAREDAMDIIYNTFIKILRADFLHDRYEPIKSTQEDIIRDAGLSGSIKEYIDKYIDMGVVHPEDAGTYRDFANPDRVLEHFRNNKKSLRLIFRRLLDGEYKWMELVVSKSKDYSDEIPVFIYYLREVRYIYEDTMVSEIEKKKQTIYSQGK